MKTKYRNNININELCKNIKVYLSFKGEAKNSIKEKEALQYIKDKINLINLLLEEYEINNKDFIDIEQNTFIKYINFKYYPKYNNLNMVEQVLKNLKNDYYYFIDNIEHISLYTYYDKNYLNIKDYLIENKEKALIELEYIKKDEELYLYTALITILYVYLNI